jgi:hypothetical protein
MLKRHMTIVGIFVGLSVVLLGCAGNLPQPERADIVDAHYGKSFESAKNDQILNPEAEEPTPVEGFDGKSANNQMEKYREELKEVREVTPSVGVGRGVSAAEY